VPDVYNLVSSEYTLFVTGKKREFNIDAMDSSIQSDVVVVPLFTGACSGLSRGAVPISGLVVY